MYSIFISPVAGQEDGFKKTSTLYVPDVFTVKEGFISVVVVIDAQTGKIVAGPDIHARGFAEDASLFDEVKIDIEKALAAAVVEGINGTHQLSQVVRRTIGGWVGAKHRRRPMIIPLVIEV